MYIFTLVLTYYIILHHKWTHVSPDWLRKLCSWLPINDSRDHDRYLLLSVPPCLELLTKPEKVPGLLPRNVRHLNNAVQVFKPRIWHQSNHRSLSLSVQYPIIAHCGYDPTGWFSWCHYWKSLSTNLEHWLLLHLYFHIISWQNCPPRYIYTQVTNLNRDHSPNWLLLAAINYIFKYIARILYKLLIQVPAGSYCYLITI
jgi:hypothetical protein